MSKVTGIALKDFDYKDEQYSKDDEVSIDAKHAALYERNHFVKFNREESKKVEAVEEKKATKQDAVIPKAPPKTK
jgi:hypothetical protein